MEASGCFNAGRGAVADRDGGVTLDAAIMDGATRGDRRGRGGTRSWPVAIPAARLVMDRTAHVLLVGAGGGRVRARGGVPAAAPGYFRAARAAEAGTVGAVALDAAGGWPPPPRPVASRASSRAGSATRRWSARGPGRTVGARSRRPARASTSSGPPSPPGSPSACRRAACPLAEATRRALADVVALGGHGGCIAVDVEGNVAMPFSTEVMYRGVVAPGESPRVWVFPLEPLAIAARPGTDDDGERRRAGICRVRKLKGLDRDGARRSDWRAW